MTSNSRILTVIISGMFLLTMGSCTSIKKKLDQSGMDDIAHSILSDFRIEDPDSLKSYIDQFSLPDRGQVEIPENIKTRPLKTWILDENIIHEKITFSSKLKKSNGRNDTAIFYLYRHRDLNNQKVILWVPGFGVSDFAFRFIRHFFKDELDAGYAVLFYNIPYHLERIEAHREMGEGFVTGSIINNLEVIKHSLTEIETVVAYLRTKGVNSISGWGGSIGGALLWLSSSSLEFDHLTLMIPIVDWNPIIFNSRMSEVVERMKSAGYTEELIRKAFYEVSPLRIPSRTDPDRIQLLYARHDQLTPESKTLEFADKWNIKNVIGYDESHASILINSGVFEDHRQFLQKLPN